MNQAQKRTLMAVAALTLLTAGCAKKKVAAAPPPPPRLDLYACGRTKGDSARRATATTQPPSTTTPASRYPNAATRARIDQLLAKIEDAYFDYDKASLRPDALKALEADSTELRDILKDYPDYKLTIEGHCDERGSDEYNLALGDRRAQAAKDYLVQVGIPAAQLNLISYGKEHAGLPGARRSLLAAESPHPHCGHGSRTVVTLRGRLNDALCHGPVADFRTGPNTRCRLSIGGLMRVSIVTLSALLLAGSAFADDDSGRAQAHGQVAAERRKWARLNPPGPWRAWAVPYM